MYYLSEPPYFLLIFGLVVGITSGSAFEALLKQKVQAWSKNSATQRLDRLQGWQLQLPFLGICLGICIFLATGFEIFSLNRWLAYGASLLLTILMGSLVWTQLGKLLRQLEEGGSKALDLDAFN
jgi:cobalamin biosynthesis protein CobD/CbiB